MIRTLLILAAAAALASAADPHFGTSTISLGSGVATEPGGDLLSAFHPGPSFAADFEFRLHKYLAATLGGETYLLKVDQGGRFPLPPLRESVRLMPFGLRGILPLSSRAELFLGAGGAPIWTSDFNLASFGSRDRILFHANAGFRVALDSKHRFFVGPTVRHYRDLGRSTQQWLSVTGEFSFRFGR